MTRLLEIPSSIWLSIILLTGLFLRLNGIYYGLPSIYDGDENYFVHYALQIIKTRDLNPHWFGHPGSTVIYLLSSFYLLIYLIGKGIGFFGSPVDFWNWYYRDPTFLYLTSRLIFVLFGMGTIVLTYWTAARIFTKRIALLSALLIAVLPLHTLFSRNIRTDVLMTLLIQAVFLCSLNLAGGKARGRDYALTGLLTGLAITTKYPAVVIVLVSLISHFYFNRVPFRQHTWRLSLWAAGVLLGAFLSSPYLFLDFKTVLQDVSLEAPQRWLSGTGGGFVSNLIWYVGQPLRQEFHLTGLLLIAWGHFLCWTSQDRQKILLTIFPMAFLVFLSLLPLRWDRWAIPLLPFACIFAASALSDVSDRATRNRGFQWAALLGLLILLAYPMLKTTYLKGREMATPDSRALARTWILDHVKPGSRLLLEAYSPQLPKDLYRIFGERDGEIKEVHPEQQPFANYRPDGIIGRLKRPDSISQMGIDFVLLSNYYDRYLGEEKAYPEIVACYRRIMGMGTLAFDNKRVINTRIYRMEK